MILTVWERAAVVRALVKDLRDPNMMPADKRHALAALRKIDSKAAADLEAEGVVS